jgi:hypothetical protein
MLSSLGTTSRAELPNRAIEATLPVVDLRHDNWVAYHDDPPDFGRRVNLTAARPGSLPHPTSVGIISDQE